MNKFLSIFGMMFVLGCGEQKFAKNNVLPLVRKPVFVSENIQNRMIF